MDGPAPERMLNHWVNEALRPDAHRQLAAAFMPRAAAGLDTRDRLEYASALIAAVHEAHDLGYEELPSEATLKAAAGLMRRLDDHRKAERTVFPMPDGSIAVQTYLTEAALMIVCRPDGSASVHGDDHGRFSEERTPKSCGQLPDDELKQMLADAA